MESTVNIAKKEKSSQQLEQPESVILSLYDLGIEGCYKSDKEKVRKILTELIASLNFDYYDMANSFCELYKYAINAVNENKFEEVLTVLQGLRDAWMSLIHANDGASQRNLN